LSDFDSELLIGYAITDVDLTNVYLYPQAMQPYLDPGTWGDIRIGSYYGTSALLHEVVELRILLRREPYLLTFAADEIRAFARESSNQDAHLRGLEAEYRYLQSTVQRVFGRQLDIGALLQANSKRQVDWDDLFDTDLPFFEPTADEVRDAEEVLAWLRAIGRR
jgi:hypothetical protein